MLENPSWLARILNANGTTAGTGIAIDPGHVITCAHLPVGPENRLVEKGQTVRLEFPFQERDPAAVAEGPSPQLEARVILIRN